MLEDKRMARKFQELRSQMTPQQRQRSQEIAGRLRVQMALADLRQARRLTQEEIAEMLGNRQAAVSKIERRADMHVSALRRPGRIVVGRREPVKWKPSAASSRFIAHFPEGDVRISQ